MTTATETQSTVVEHNGALYIGARAQALGFRSNIQSTALLNQVMRVLADKKIEDITQQADLLLRYAFDGASELEQPFLLGTVLAFYGTNVQDTNEYDTELSATGLTAAQLAYWREKLEARLDQLIKTAYGDTPLALQAAGLVVGQLLSSIETREGRVAGLTLVMASALCPYQPPYGTPISVAKEHELLGVVRARVKPLVQEGVLMISCSVCTPTQCTSRLFELAHEAELDTQETKVFFAEVYGALLKYGSLITLDVKYASHGEAEEKSDQGKTAE